MPELPTGTVTFLFTDIEGSTRLWEQHPDAMRLALARHDVLVTDAIQQHGGIVVKHRGEGDSLFAVFARASDALAAACALQQTLPAEPWPIPTPLRVRAALHTGQAELRDDDYYGPSLNRCARLRATAHGGQVLLSGATEELVREALPEGASLRDLGLCRLPDLTHPEHVFQLVHPALPADFPPLRSLDALRTNLPRQLTSFIGREQAMAEVKELLSRTALLTITGSGGCGKTRLALQVAADLLEAYTDGVWLVELAALGDPSLVPQTVASALGVREQPGRPLTETLVDYLKAKAPLLILDNCEHLLAACASLADILLRSCPSLRMLASSREALGIGGEQTYRVPSLSLPDAGHLPPLEHLHEFEAVQLFADRARLSQATFAVTQANARSVAQVCQRLDGIPLAIELAAARVRALPVEQIHARLDDMFRLLTGGSRTALPRQQTLRALIDWSYDLLSPSEKVLLRRLSVFAGGWTLEAAEAVGVGEGIEEWEVLDLLTSMVEKSLVLYEEQDGEGRYRLLETVRQYACDRLLEAGEAEDVRGRHLAFFLNWAEQWPDWKRLETEHDNLRAALGWSRAQGQGEVGLRIAGAVAYFWRSRGYLGEGQEHLAGLLALPGAEARTAARARALAAAGMLACLLGECGTARALHEESLAIRRELGGKSDIAGSLLDLGWVVHYQGDYGAARALHEESLAIYRELGDKGGIAFSLCHLGIVARDQGEYGQRGRSSRRAWRASGSPGSSGASPGRSVSWDRWSAFRGSTGQHGRSWRRAWRSTGRSGENLGIAQSLCGLGTVAGDQGEYGIARALFEESLATYRELGVKQGIAPNLEGLAAVAVAQAQSERAARLFGTAESIREAFHFPLPPADRAERDRSVAAGRIALGEKAFAAAWAEGRAMPLEEALTYALAK